MYRAHGNIVMYLRLGRKDRRRVQVQQPVEKYYSIECILFSIALTLCYGSLHGSDRLVRTLVF